MYRKFKADYIFTGHTMLDENNILITDENGTVKDIVPPEDAGDDVQVFTGLLTPGFVNCHCHLELSHLKGRIPEQTGLVNFVQEVMSRRSFPAEQKLAAMAAAEQEMYKNGIVAVGDICNTADSIVIKQQSKLQWHNFIEVSGFVDAAAEKRLSEIKLVYDAFRSANNEQRTTLSPHAPYSVSKKLFELLNESTSNQLITIHNQECTAENELYQNKTGDFLQLYKNFGIDITSFMPTGKTSLQSWLPYFTNNQSVIAVHNTFIADEDFALLPVAKAGLPSLFFCLCANANSYIENTFPPIKSLLENNCKIVLGTDSYASNRQLNILEEIKTIALASLSIPLTTILQWATINGAEALAMQGKLGSFEKGKQPGIILINNLSGNNITTQSAAVRIL